METGLAKGIGFSRAVCVLDQFCALAPEVILFRVETEGSPQWRSRTTMGACLDGKDEIRALP